MAGTPIVHNGPTISSASSTPVLTHLDSTFDPITERHNVTKFPASTHLTFIGGLTAVILPITLVPYVFARRRLSALQRRFNELESLTRNLQRELHAAAVATTRTSTTADIERRRMNALLKEVKQEAKEANSITSSLELKLKENDERELLKDSDSRAMQSELQYLLEEAKITRTQGDAVRSLGLSLADIAAFMHEVELWMPQVDGARRSPSDKSRVEQLRLSALMLQNLPRQRPIPKK
ncbi:hypothetical protein J3R30DRAFT_1055019 [Lentinula aciculospora]|uniref:Uncharacterized protein n=1 Tax=Lentinula aciculospora TaxID=153920 RepID=A0A9W9DII4_9AGAR|nr:hypothetical protein J3R30DRAFT_1055019 [Lentinula aciculospora]